jgi:hypothetical protein
MFNIFKSDPKKKLQKKYAQLMKEAHQLSTVNRKLSDQKYAEAERLMDDILK